jgi:hypothetical protein
MTAMSLIRLTKSTRENANYRVLKAVPGGQWFTTILATQPGIVLSPDA